MIDPLSQSDLAIKRILSGFADSSCSSVTVGDGSQLWSSQINSSLVLGSSSISIGAFDSHDLFTLLSSQMEMAVGDSASASGSPGSCPCFSFPHMICF